jgi:hypothetical protein
MVNLNFFYRALLIVSTIGFLILWFLPYTNYSNSSEYELSLLSGNSYESILPNNDLIYWSLFAIWMILSIGLYFYKKIARALFLIMIIVTSLANFFWGYRVFTPLEAGLVNAISISDGAILVLVYFSALNSRFQ